MKRFARCFALIGCMAFPTHGWAQEAAPIAPEATKPDITAEQVLEHFIEATGGREAYERLTSFVAIGKLEMAAQGIAGTVEIYAKAPSKFLTIQKIEGVGTVHQGYDGHLGWSQDPFQGTRELEGVELANFKRQATFNADLKWRELYKQVELVGTEKVGDQDTYVVRLTPDMGSPITRYYNTQTFLLVREDSVYEGAQGTIPGQEYSSDYREVNGVKIPFRHTAKLPAGEVVMEYTEIKTNVRIDDAKFAKPAESEP